MTEYRKPAVGDSFYFVPSVNYRKPESVTVTKVGRKWATLSNDIRLDISTGELERQNYGHGNPGELFSSEEAWVEHSQMKSAWDKFRRQVGTMYRMPAGLTMERLVAAEKMILRGEVKS